MIHLNEKRSWTGRLFTFQIDPSMNFALNTYELVGSLPGGNNNI